MALSEQQYLSPQAVTAQVQQDSCFERALLARLEHNSAAITDRECGHLESSYAHGACKALSTKYMSLIRRACLRRAGTEPMQPSPCNEQTVRSQTGAQLFSRISDQIYGFSEEPWAAPITSWVSGDAACGARCAGFERRLALAARALSWSALGTMGVQMRRNKKPQPGVRLGFRLDA